MAITKWDDYFIHQAPYTFDKAEPDVPDSGCTFTERTFFSCHSTDGSIYLMAGLGAYPNLNLTDGFVGVQYKGTQHNIRLSGHLLRDRSLTEIGPYSLQVLEPLKRWKIDLADNEYGLACSLEFEATTAARSYWPRIETKRERGGSNIAAFDQAGRYSGNITIGRQRFDAAGFYGGRDHTWSNNRKYGAAGSPGSYDRMDLELWIVAHFSDSTFCFGPCLERRGALVVGTDTGIIAREHGSAVDVAGIRHRIDFEPGTRSYTRIELSLDGNRTLVARPLSAPIYLSGGGYDNWFGIDRGKLHIEGETWDVSSPVGFEPPLAGVHHRVAEFQLDGKRGVGFIESCFGSIPDWHYRPTL